MGFISAIFKRIIRLILYLSIFVAFIVFIPNLPPYINFSRIEIEPTQPKVGASALNDALNNAEPLYKGKLLGPETFQIWNGEVYTGLATGEIVKVSPGGHVTFVTKIGQPCTGLLQEHICGRPLGFVIDEKNKFMYIADAYHGIWKVNLLTDKKQLLVSPHVAIDGKVPKLFNSVALDKDGELYYTISSSDFHLRDGVIALLADPSGRLLHYNAAKNSSKVLLDDLWFPNGLTISQDNQFVVVAESGRIKLTKYYINGPKKGTSEVFIAGLSGVPDNLRTLPDGSGVLASLYLVFDEEHPYIMKSLAATPLARKFLTRLMRLIEIPFEFLNSQFPNHIFETIVHEIGNFGAIVGVVPGPSGLIKIDWEGNIVAAYYNTDGSVKHISDAIVYNNKLYFGAAHIQNFIASVPAPPELIKAFTAKKAKVEPNVKATSTEQVKPKVEVKQTVKRTTSPPPTTTPPPPPTTTKPPPPPTTTTKPPPTTTTKPPPTTTKPPPPTTTTKPPPPTTKPPPPTTTPPPPKPSTTTTPPSTTSPPPPTTKKPTTASNNMPKENVIKQNAIPKEVKLEQKDEVSKPKAKVTTPTVEVKKDMNTKTVPKQGDEKPKVAPKDEKSKIKETDTKPKVTQQAEAKSKAPQNTEQKRIKKEAPKDNVKPKAENLKTSKDKTGAKASETDKKASKESIPIEEDIPSDTIKPNKEPLKVIKKNGPQEIPNPIL